MRVKVRGLFFPILLSFIFLHPSSSFALFDDKEKSELRKQIETLKAEGSRLSKDLAEVTSDRDNILKQAKNFLKEKEELTQKMKEVKLGTAETHVEIDSLKKENEILKSETDKLEAARRQDAKIFKEERQAYENRIADYEARAQSLVRIAKEYTPEKIHELIEDRNRLQAENKTMAQRIFENERRMDEFRKHLTPLHLDREELHRVQEQNREYLKRVQYVDKLEERQKQLIKENAEYRERLEVLKAKFKEAAPGLAKSSRISQKMMRENADMHYNLGTIFLHNKQYRESIREYERVLELRPTDPETHYNLGVLYDDYLKDREKALYHYQKYLAINPRAPDAKRVESYILAMELEQKVR